jgi:thiamine monophosphate synthase
MARPASNIKELSFHNEKGASSMNRLQQLHTALQERSLLKVIAGIDNFDSASVMAIAQAAEQGGAQAVDIACDPALIKAIKATTNLIVFVSSTDPAKLLEAAQAGADVLELGNYDALYHQGIHPTSAQILDWARAIKAGAANTPVCVTISGRLPLAEQLDLAATLQAMGIDILQTEGVVGPMGDDAHTALTGALAALANTAEIRKVVEMPLLLAGGMNTTSAPFAIAAGADALGVGKAVTRLNDPLAMAEAVRAIRTALAKVQATGRGLANAH